jgi:hypothetical protein
LGEPAAITFSVQSAAYAEVKKDVAHAERLGGAPQRHRQLGPPRPTERSIERLKEHEARIGGELGELQRELDACGQLG